ncbi:hypothetical protein ACFW82_05255, partial [Streptomyces sp. NPDC058728]
MKQRAPLTLAAAAAALAALTGLAALTAPAAGSAGPAAAASRMPVERSLVVCPAPSTSDLADTPYTAFT